MSEHTPEWTPGPWWASREGYVSGWTAGPLALVIRHDSGTVACVNSNYNLEAEANARLIAAAPLLVEACKEALAWLDCPPNRSPPGITQKLSAALAAVGE